MLIQYSLVFELWIRTKFLVVFFFRILKHCIKFCFSWTKKLRFDSLLQKIWNSSAGLNIVFLFLCRLLCAPLFLSPFLLVAVVIVVVVVYCFRLLIGVSPNATCSSS